MNVNRSTVNYELIPLIIFNLIILCLYSSWALLPPNQIFSIVLLASLTVIAFYMLKGLTGAFPICIFLIYGLIFTLLIGSPDWDARSIWLFHAKRIFFDNSLYAQLDNYASFSHNDYPVIFSSISATLAKAIGHWNEVFPKSVVNIFLIPPLIFFAIIYRSALLTLLFIFGIGIACRNYLFNGYQDALVALYSASIILLILFFSKNKNFDLTQKFLFSLLLFSFSSILLFLKNEGLAINFILFLILFIFQKSIPKKYILINFLFLLLFYLLIWKIPVYLSNIQNDLITTGIFDRILNRLLSISDIFLILSYFIKYCGIYLFIFFINLLRKDMFFKDLKIPLLFIFFYFALLFFIYLSTPSDLQWHLGTSVKRALLPINVLIVGIILYTFSNKFSDLRLKL